MINSTLMKVLDDQVLSTRSMVIDKFDAGLLSDLELVQYLRSIKEIRDSAYTAVCDLHGIEEELEWIKE